MSQLFQATTGKSHNLGRIFYLVVLDSKHTQGDWHSTSNRN